MQRVKGGAHTVEQGPLCENPNTCNEAEPAIGCNACANVPLDSFGLTHYGHARRSTIAVDPSRGKFLIQLHETEKATANECNGTRQCSGWSHQLERLLAVRRRVKVDVPVK